MKNLTLLFGLISIFGVSLSTSMAADSPQEDGEPDLFALVASGDYTSITEFTAYSGKELRDVTFKPKLHVEKNSRKKIITLTWITGVPHRSRASSSYQIDTSRVTWNGGTSDTFVAPTGTEPYFPIVGERNGIKDYMTLCDFIGTEGVGCLSVQDDGGLLLRSWWDGDPTKPATAVKYLRDQER